MSDLLKRLSDASETWGEDDGGSLYTAAFDEIERLQSQLPEGMKHCAIKFLECEHGHGRLTATNWVQHPCPNCEIERLQRELGEWKANIMDALIVGHIYQNEHETNPRKALHDLLAWEAHIALDPAVSSDARALIDAARQEAAQEMRARCADLCTKMHSGGGTVVDGGRVRLATPADCSAAIRALPTAAPDDSEPKP